MVGGAQGDRAPPRRTSSSHWAASDDPSHWNYWRREALAYENDLAGHYRGDGIDAPKLLRSFTRPGGEIALWLEDVVGVPGTAWPLERYAAAAQSLGRAQGRLAERMIPAYPWLSRRFLRSYSGSKPADWNLLDDDSA